MRILAVVAHPDDESLWCGGTLAQHARVGDEVFVYALADGVGSVASVAGTWPGVLMAVTLLQRQGEARCRAAGRG